MRAAGLARIVIVVALKDVREHVSAHADPLVLHFDTRERGLAQHFIRQHAQIIGEGLAARVPRAQCHLTVVGREARGVVYQVQQHLRDAVAALATERPR